VAQPSADWWRPTRALATWLTWLLVAQAAGQAASIFLDSATPFVRMHAAFDALLDGRNETAQRLFDHASDGYSQPVTRVVGYVAVATTVLLMIWAWRSAHNARALGRTGARLGPVWAIIGWIIPVASFVLPYLVVSDLWRSSDPDAPRGDGWRARPPSPLVAGWWILYVGAQLLGAAAIGLAVSGTTDRSQSDVLLAASHVVGAVAPLLTMLVVRHVTDRQAAQQAADPAPTTRPAARDHRAPSTADGPGWYPDPARVADHRYWDGSGWTEHVSSAGVASTAPVTPPDWYPDPTGRFHWRYWTGHEWTEHVSRDEQLFLDPIDDAPPV
jgi:hypothetical protein